MALIMGGCGLKGNPVPPQIMAPPPIADLKASSISQGVLLDWTVPTLVGNVASFKIVRSVTLDGSLACPGCPQEYQPLATASLTDANLSREGEKGFRYYDLTVRDGSYYSYRIQACSRSGQCSEASNEAGLVYQKDSGQKDSATPEKGQEKRPEKGPEKKTP